MSAEKSATNEPAFEPCPTPLDWKQIAQSFHTSANSRIICTDQAEIKVTEFGEGPPVVFFPAMCGSARLFCLTAWLLKDEYRSLLIEFPKFRRIPSPRTLVADCAESIGMTIEHLCPDGADVYASLFSGQVALEIMASQPKVIRSAILQGVWANRQLTGTERTLLKLGRYFPGKLRHLPYWKTAQIENHRRWFPPFDETRFGFLLQEAGETSTRLLSSQLLASTLTDLHSQLKNISQRILILHCEGEGHAIARAEEEMERQLPNVSREEMYHSGYFPYLTHPHRLVKILRPFLEMRE